MKLCVFFAFLLIAQLVESIDPQVQPLKAIKQAPKVLLPASDYLSFTYYLNSCPGVEGIIQEKVKAWFRKDYTLAASIIRLQFRDCAVRGCDGSILLNHPGSERRAKSSRTLRGFEVIDDIKAEVERRCRRTVSCADILIAAARDATVLVGGPFWEVTFGRKDGRISIAKEVDIVPQGHENVTTLIEFFRAKGLNELDLVILSGSHTIGRTSCYSILHRLAKPDPTLDIKYWKNLRKKCRRGWNLVELDITTPKAFDTAYYSNLQKKWGLLSTDEALYSNEITAAFVNATLSQPSLFENQFAASMVKLGNVQVLTRKNEGEIRLNCNSVNKIY
ncbi:hypothetical protein CRYUN_Cryun33cG0002100 [Craigia yunnanensis]